MTPKHILEARAIGAQALLGVEQRVALRALRRYLSDHSAECDTRCQDYEFVVIDYGTRCSCSKPGALSLQLQEAKRVAGKDWPGVEDLLSLITVFGTPSAWGDLVESLARECRYGFWWFEEKGPVFVAVSPPERLARRCEHAAGMEQLSFEGRHVKACSELELGSRPSYVWYPPEGF